MNYSNTNKGACVVALQKGNDIVQVIVPTNNIKRFRQYVFNDNTFRDTHATPEHTVAFIHNIKGDVSYLGEGHDFKENEFTMSDIMEEYEALGIAKKLEITNEAMKYMHQHNGRSVLHCKALAMGYVLHEEDEDGIYIKK